MHLWETELIKNPEYILTSQTNFKLALILRVQEITHLAKNS